MMNAINKKGMTLVELLVYMALAALLLAPIIMLMNNSSKNMARDAATTDMRISGRDIVGIMYDDIKNTGFKIRYDGSITTMYEVTYKRDGFVDPADTNRQDLSSFDLRDGSTIVAHPEAGKFFDILTIKKGRLDSNGDWEGYDTITYYAEDVKPTPDGKSYTGKLIRKSYRFNYSPASNTHVLAAGQPEELVLADNVEALQFRADSVIIDNIPNCHIGDTCDVKGKLKGDWEWKDHLPAPPRVGVYGYYELLANADAAHLKNKHVKNIQAIVILRHGTQKGTIKTYPEEIVIKDPNGDESKPLKLPSTNVMRERYEIVIPIPNNGLFP